MLRHLLASGLALSLVDGAAAQQVPSPFVDADATLLRDGVAGARNLVGYTAPGVRLGSLVMRPELALRAAYDSNVLNLADNKRDDGLLLIEPSLRLGSDWGRHSLALAADGRIARFANLTSENSETFGGRLSGRLDVGASTNLSLSARIGKRLESRGAGGTSLPATGPTLYRDAAASIGAATGRGPVRISLAGGWAERRYDDLASVAGPIDQQFRDMRILSIAPRIEWRMNPGFGLFGAARITSAKSVADRSETRRDSDGLALTGGVTGDLAALVAGEVEVGWRRQSYDSPRYLDWTGLTFQSRLDWYPTPLVSLSFRAGQDFQNSGIADVAAILSRSAEAQAFYELRRNLLLGADLRYRHDQFREIEAKAEGLELGIRAQWRLMPTLAAAARLGWRDRWVSDPERLSGYSGLQVSVGLEGRL